MKKALPQPSKQEQVDAERARIEGLRMNQRKRMVDANKLQEGLLRAKADVEAYDAEIVEAEKKIKGITG